NAPQGLQFLVEIDRPVAPVDSRVNRRPEQREALAQPQLQGRLPGRIEMRPGMLSEIHERPRTSFSVGYMVKDSAARRHSQNPRWPSGPGGAWARSAISGTPSHRLRTENQGRCCLSPS